MAPRERGRHQRCRAARHPGSFALDHHRIGSLSRFHRSKNPRRRSCLVPIASNDAANGTDAPSRFARSRKSTATRTRVEQPRVVSTRSPGHSSERSSIEARGARLRRHGQERRRARDRPARRGRGLRPRGRRPIRGPSREIPSLPVTCRSDRSVCDPRSRLRKQAFGRPLTSWMSSCLAGKRRRRCPW